MKGTRKRKISKRVLVAIILVALFALVVITTAIVNIFIPLKYLSAYTAKRDINSTGNMRVTFVDVGFGDCAIVELPDGKCMLIDSGDGSYPSQLALFTLLNSKGIEHIDYLICTSVKSEHCGGFAELFDYKTVGKAYIPYCANKRITDEYSAFYSALTESGAEICIAEVGEGAASEGEYSYFFTFLSPASRLSPLSPIVEMNSSPTSENIDNASAVVWLQYNEAAFAFVSDARDDTLSAVAEGYYLVWEIGQSYCPVGDYSVNLTDCDVTTIPGHGGEKCATSEWFTATAPDYSVLNVGKNFGDYPCAEGLSGASAVGSEIVTTMESGNLTFTVSADGDITLSKEIE